MQMKATEGYRLSPLQKRLWLLQKHFDGTYTAHCSVLVEGALDERTLRRALEDVVEANEILRTGFLSLPGIEMPLQIIGEGEAPLVQLEDLSALSPPEQEARVEDLLTEAEQVPFNTEQGPVLRVSLVTLSHTRSVLILCLPALCADAAGLKNLVKEIIRSYEACLKGETDSDERIQYAELAEWQNELLELEEAEIGREFWLKRGARGSLDLKLPFEKQPLALSSFRPKSATLEIDRDRLNRIEAEAESVGRPVSSLILACWQVLIGRYAGLSEFVLGAAFDGRRDEGLREALGLLTKYLPLESRLDEGEPLLKLVEHVDDSLRELSEWQDYYESNEPEFLPVCFEYVGGPFEYQVDELRFSLRELRAQPDRFRIKLSCFRRLDGLLLNFHYDPESFSEDSIARVKDHFLALLDSLISNPESIVSQLNILSECERRQLLFELNDTKAQYPCDRCFHEIFEDHALRQPDKVAIIFEQQHITLGELNARANRLAHHLRRSGVRAEARVGLCADRTPEMVIGLLGILKAGGVYVPIDPVYPKQRLDFMLRDYGARVLLTQHAYRSNFDAEQVHIIDLDDVRETISAEAAGALASDVTGDNLAYVIYTSGSSGQPKAVMVTHRGLTNYLTWSARYYRIDEGCGAPVHSSISFDLTITSLLTPLSAGQAVLLLPASDGVAQLSDALGSAGDFGLVKITPSHLAILNSALSAEVLEGQARALVIGGESLKGESLFFWQQHAPGTRLINEYGPTETVVGCCIYEVSPENRINGAVPIGRPISNTLMFVLDRKLEVVPIGLSGEIFIGGDGVARGYLGRPDLTAEKFIPNPFGDKPGGRMYRSGDMGRYLPDLGIDFLGRVDGQVKIRSFRVEVGEIEAVLQQHPELREALVLVREDAPDDRQLIAYLVSGSDTAPSSAQLRSFLLERLPEYMVPVSFVWLDRMPLTQNGKLDRSALPAPEAIKAHSAEEYTPPQTELERLIASIWKEVLKAGEVGINNNFFDLGGHSLLMVRVHSKLCEQLSKDIPITDLFKYSTVSSLASFLSQTNSNQSPLLEDKQAERLNAGKDRLRQQLKRSLRAAEEW